MLIWNNCSHFVPLGLCTCPVWCPWLHCGPHSGGICWPFSRFHGWLHKYRAACLCHVTRAVWMNQWQRLSQPGVFLYTMKTALWAMMVETEGNSCTPVFSSPSLTVWYFKASQCLEKLKNTASLKYSYVDKNMTRASCCGSFCLQRGWVAAVYHLYKTLSSTS